MMLSNTATPKYYGMFRDQVLRGEIPVCNEIDDRKIMTDEKIGKAILLLQVLEQVQHLTLYRDIQC